MVLHNLHGPVAQLGRATLGVVRRADPRRDVLPGCSFLPGECLGGNAVVLHGAEGTAGHIAGTIYIRSDTVTGTGFCDRPIVSLPVAVFPRSGGTDNPVVPVPSHPSSGGSYYCCNPGPAHLMNPDMISAADFYFQEPETPLRVSCPRSGGRRYRDRCAVKR